MAGIHSVFNDAFGRHWGLMTTHLEKPCNCCFAYLSGFLPSALRRDSCMRYSQRTQPQKPQRSRSSAKKMTIQDAIDAYVLHHRATNSQPKTIEWHTHCLGAFRTYCDGIPVTLLEEVTIEHAQRWVIDLQKPTSPRGKRSTRTVSWYFRSLRAFWHASLKAEGDAPPRSTALRSRLPGRRD